MFSPPGKVFKNFAYPVFAIVFIFLVTAGRFEPFLHPLAILMSLPPAGALVLQ